MNDSKRCAMTDGPMRCVLPADHPGDYHEYHAALSPELAKLLGDRIDALDAQLAYWRRENRRVRLLFWLLLIALAINVGSIIHWLLT